MALNNACDGKSIRSVNLVRYSQRSIDALLQSSGGVIFGDRAEKIAQDEIDVNPQLTKRTSDDQ